MNNPELRIRRVRLTQHGVSYFTFELSGSLGGQRVRKRFKTRAEAEAEQNRLEVQAANADGAIKTVTTRLTLSQLADAEAAFTRLGDRSLTGVLDWYFNNFRPPTVEMAVEKAAEAFAADRKGNISAAVAEDYGKVLGLLKRTFPERSMHTITTAELEALMKTRGQAKKSWNNLRGYLHAIFEYCAHDGRRWLVMNPVKAIRVYDIARGLPHILTVEQVRELFTYLETYSGPPRCCHRPGFLVPYFALATFAGIRPCVVNGELRKLHSLPDKSRVIDEKIGVIRMTPDVTKTNCLRQVTIQPNLAAWLERYPLKDWPLMVENMADQVAAVRKHFKLKSDVLRHTFVSMHVAKFKSLGSTALEAGNSEAIIRRHYLNLVSPSDAEAFWAIVPNSASTIQ